jgi:hypothetical protein
MDAKTDLFDEDKAKPDQLLVAHQFTACSTRTSRISVRLQV